MEVQMTELPALVLGNIYSGSQRMRVSLLDEGRRPKGQRKRWYRITQMYQACLEVISMATCGTQAKDWGL